MKKFSIAAGITLLTLWGFYLRTKGLDPSSLWYDDLWLGATTLRKSLSDFFEVKVPVPLLFNISQWGMRHLFPDPETSLQYLPMIFGTLSIPLSYWMTRLLGARALSGFLVATCVALSPTLLTLSLSVKQYSSEVFFSFAVVSLFFLTLRKGTRGSYIAFILVSALSLFFSYGLALVTGALINALWLWSFIRLRSKPAEAPNSHLRRYALGAFFFNTFALICYYELFRRQINTVMYFHWREHLGFGETAWEAVRNFFSSWVLSFTSAFPRGLEILAALCPLGLYLLWRTPCSRLPALGFSIFFLARIVFSLIGKYPLGMARTDAFSFPLVLSLAIVGWERGLDKLKSTKISTGLSLLALAGLAVFYGRSTPEIGAGPSPQAIATLNASTESDAVISLPDSNFFMGFYGRWPCTLKKSVGSAQNFITHCTRERFLQLPYDIEGHLFFDRTVDYVTLVKDFLEENSTPRLYMLVYYADANPKFFEAIRAEVERHGYQENSKCSDGYSLLCFARAL